MPKRTTLIIERQPVGLNNISVEKNLTTKFGALFGNTGDYAIIVV